MALDWQELKISQAKLDDVFEVNLVDSWAIVLSKVLLIGKKQELKRLLSIEASLLFVSLLVSFPIALIVFRKLELIANNSNGMSVVLVATLLVSTIFLSLFNYFLWQKAKQLKLLSKLLDKVATYNSLIEHFQWLENINRISVENQSTIKSISSTQSFKEFKGTLELIRNSLLDSIKLESSIYQNRQLRQNFSYSSLDRDRLLSSLEDNLIALSLPEVNSDREYRELIEEAVELGLSLHREIRKMPKS